MTGALVFHAILAPAIDILNQMVHHTIVHFTELKLEPDLDQGGVFADRVSDARFHAVPEKGSIRHTGQAFKESPYPMLDCAWPDKWISTILDPLFNASNMAAIVSGDNLLDSKLSDCKH